MVGTTGSFNRLVALNTVPLGSHTLTVKGTDLAGNVQQLDYRFQLKQDTPPVDNDPDAPDTPPGNPNNRGGNSYPNFGFSGSGWGSGGGSGGGWGWGWLNLGGGGSGSPSYWTPPPAGNGYGPSEPPIPYVERIREILDTASKAMPVGVRRGALKRRMAALNEFSRTVELGNLYDEMQYGLYGIYYLASQIQTRTEAKNLGHFLATQLKDENDPAVRVQALQTTLLAAVTEALKVNQTGGLTLNLQQQEGLARSVMEMAYTYAMWNPVEPEAGKVTPGFLNELWQSQLVGQTGKFSGVVTQIRELLAGVNDPVKALNFINNLLKATNEVESLKDDLRDPVFLKELIQFGFDYVKLNPDTSLSAEPQGFLDVLWRATPDNEEALQAAIKKGAAGLSEFFEGADTQAKLLKRIKFAKDLIEAAKLAPLTQGQVRDPRFVDALIGLGSAYAAIDPFVGTTSPDPKLFLNTLWQSQNVQKASDELGKFIFDLDTPVNPTEIFDFNKKLLKALKIMPDADLQTKIQNASFINGMTDWGAKYIASKYNEDLIVDDLSNFFQEVADGKYEQGVLIASKVNSSPNWFTRLVNEMIKAVERGEERLRYIFIKPLISITDPLDRSYAKQSLPLIIKESFDNNVTRQDQIAYIIATAEHESKLGRKMFEESEFPPGSVAEQNYFNKKYEDFNGNGDYSSGDGYRYRGRGYIQLTGRNHYDYFKWSLRPDAVAFPSIAASIIVQGMKLGIITGVSLNTYFNQNGSDFFHARRIVNDLDRANDIAQRAVEYFNAIKKL